MHDVTMMVMMVMIMVMVMVIMIVMNTIWEHDEQEKSSGHCHDYHPDYVDPMHYHHSSSNPSILFCSHGIFHNVSIYYSDLPFPNFPEKGH